MARPSNPIRTTAEEFIRAEIERVGVAGLDGAAITKRFVARGASRARVQAWIAEAKRAAAPVSAPGAETKAAATKVDEQRELQANLETAAATAAVLDSLPTRTELQEIDASISVVSMMPGRAQEALDHLQRTIDTCNRVLTYCHAPDGRVRNPRMALQSADALRRCLETALKLYESMNNVQMIERFMAEMLAEVRPLNPDMARAVIGRMRAVQGRWAAA